MQKYYADLTTVCQQVFEYIRFLLNKFSLCESVVRFNRWIITNAPACLFSFNFFLDKKVTKTN